MAVAGRETLQHFSRVSVELKVCVCVDGGGLGGKGRVGNQMSLWAGRKTGDFNKLQTDNNCIIQCDP